MGTAQVDSTTKANITTSLSSLSPEVLEESDVPGLAPPAAENQCEAYCFRLELVGATGSPQ